MDKEYRIDLIYPRGMNDVVILNYLTKIHAKVIKYARVKAGEMISDKIFANRNSVIFSFTGTIKVYEDIKEFVTKLNIYALININEIPLRNSLT